MDSHGWGETGERLSRLAARGGWDKMPREISDEMLDAFAVTATLDELPDRLVTRYAGLLDRVTLYKPFVAGKDEAGWQALVNGIHDSAHGPTNRLRGSVLTVE